MTERALAIVAVLVLGCSLACSGGTGGAGGGSGGAGGSGGSPVADAGSERADGTDAATDAADGRELDSSTSDALDARPDTGPADAAAADAGVLEQIHYYGRWNRLADRAITVNSGSHVVAQFSGTGVSARFDVTLNQTPNPTLAWQIDRGAWVEGELAATLPLAVGLTAGAHEVTLMVRGLNENQSRWAPPLISSITFLGFTVTGGALQASASPVRPKIEFLGDSITEGVNVWTTHNGSSAHTWQTDGRVAYPTQTAQMLGAEWRQVGFGRQGLLVGGNGGVPVANDAFNWIYQGVARDSWQADLVVINQGTNDSGSSAAAFGPAYATFLGTVRAGYPAAKIAALRPFNGTHAAEIQAEVTARRAAGDARVFYVDTTGWLTAPDDFTDGLHPNPQGSMKAAQALSAAITTTIMLP